ncbi:alpha-taxilin-like isoform X2 [Littorina saxatilis]
MAAQVAQPAAEVLLPQANDNASTPPGETSPALVKVANNASAPVEDRLSSSGSPEPGEEIDAESAKAASGGGAGAGASGSKAETDGKGLTVKTKKKEDKSIEYILRALSSLNSPEEKLAALCKKYADLHEEHRVLQSSFKQQQRKMTVVQREKDQMQAEHTKAVIAKSKLESLCRELQKQNKAVKEESLLRTREDEERRKEISAKFQTTIAEIQTQMTDNHEKNVKLREENQDLAGKLKKFLEQYELREQQIEKMAKHRDLENQLADAKLSQAAAILKEEQERNLKEKELILLKATEQSHKNVALEKQLAMYKDRYEEFQGTINKSNDMFQKLKSEMDKMGKRIKKLEKEGAQWRAKWEASSKALLEMAEEKNQVDKQKVVLEKKIGKLESLCRALQGQMHGKTSDSPVPSADDTTETIVPSACDENAVSTTTATTTTPPNTPEENTSRASPAPDSSSPLSQPLPTGQNGPISAFDAGASPDSSTEACQARQTIAATAASQENQVSSSCQGETTGLTEKVLESPANENDSSSSSSTTEAAASPDENEATAS